jgi:hypothetical protein
LSTRVFFLTHCTQLARTLTLWRNLESVFAFSYAGRHGEALALRAE